MGLSQMCNILALGLFLEMTALRTTDAAHAKLAVPARSFCHPDTVNLPCTGLGCPAFT
jgi:hypothetical protein